MERMKLSTVLFTLVISLFFNVCSASKVTYTPVGYWKTIDDVTGKPKSIVRVWETPERTLAASVVKIFTTPGENPNKICTACIGEKHNKPILGMVILTGLKMGQGHWVNGKILDPNNGKTYKCAMSLSERGEKMRMHGYIGFPLFGRSQIWERVDLLSDADVQKTDKNAV